MRLSVFLALLPAAWTLLQPPLAPAATCFHDPTPVRRLRGIVVTRAGFDAHVVPGAVVRLRRGKFHAEATTDEDGHFAFPRLPPGEYELRARLAGFEDTSGTVRVSPRGAARGALVIDLAIAGVESCGSIRVESWRAARRLQRRARSSSRASAYRPPSHCGTRPWLRASL